MHWVPLVAPAGLVEPDEHGTDAFPGGPKRFGAALQFLIFPLLPAGEVVPLGQAADPQEHAVPEVQVAQELQVPQQDPVP